jgi:hypothetical protein
VIEKNVTTFDVQFKKEDIFEPENLIITEILWLSDSVLLARCMNRVQDQQKVFFIQRNKDGTWSPELKRDEKNQDGAWINLVIITYFIGLN